MPFFTARSHRHPTRAVALLILGAAAASVVMPSRPALADPDATSQPAKVDPVDYHKLKDVLPDAVGGIKRSNASGTKQSMGEMKISQAEGKYSEDGKDANATITIMDYAAMPGTAEAMASWSKMEIDNDSDDEFSKTTTISGYHALETYNKKDKTGTVMLLVGDRFIVNIEINQLPSEELTKAGEAIKLKDLEALGK